MNLAISSDMFGTYRVALVMQGKDTRLAGNYTHDCLEKAQQIAKEIKKESQNL